MFLYSRRGRYWGGEILQEIKVFMKGEEKNTHEEKERYKETLLPETSIITKNELLLETSFGVMGD